MLRIVQNSTAKGAKSYYSTSDYYTEGQELVGLWRGEGAQRLGLSGIIRKEDWDALCDNQDPRTGERLTPRQKSNRRVGYDINFHVPKSVSVLYGLTGDERLLEAFREAVDETMRDMEGEVATRVRAKGKDEDRTTGNLVWGEFVHFTARPVDGVPDPHLHAHCFAFNLTWDGQEERWKAAQCAGLKRDAPYFEALFHSRLAQKLESDGFAIARSEQSWELAGVPASAIRTFSRRTAQIEAKAHELGITDPGERAELGAKTRARKNELLSMEQLRAEWRARLTLEDEDAIAQIGRVRDEPLRVDDGEAAHRAVTFALEHCFERRAVVPERRLLAVAIKHASGKASADAIGRQLQAENLLSAERRGQRYLTTRAVLDEEHHMLDFARAGRGACAPLQGAKDVELPKGLSVDQRKAVEHVLESHDRVILVRGAAGTGKTTMMRAAVAGIEAGGHRVLVFAPSADASRGVLRSEGFGEADTVARLLLDERMQERARGQVVWVDEAGLLGTRTMERLFEVARRLDARVVLSGDRRQHGSVDRGAALSLLEDEAGLVPAQLRDIRRQHGAYKEAVRALSEGRTEAGFAQLDQLGWIRVVDDSDRDRTIAHDFVETVASGKTALVVSPTHREGDAITAEIRSELKRIGQLRGKEHSILTLSNYNWTEAERADPGHYVAGDVLAFHQNAKGYANGQRVGVGNATVPVDQASRFQVFHSGSLSVAAGDVLRITRNGKTKDGRHRLNNGQLVTVKRFTRSGDLQLSNGWTLAKDFGHLAYGYVSTSHSSQGKTVDRVFIGQSSTSAPASSREQFYVSVSRARERATIYTDDKETLLESVKRSEDRLSATELDRERRAHLRRLEMSEPSQSPNQHQPMRRVAEHVR